MIIYGLYIFLGVLNMKNIVNLDKIKQDRITQAKFLYGADFEPIILFLTDTDLYKFTMQQAVLHQFSGATSSVFKFKCRNEGVDLVKYKKEIETQLDWLCNLDFTSIEIEYLASRPYFKEDYIDFLTNFKLQRKHITVEENNNELNIVVKAPWINAIMFEIYVLAIVNETYFKNKVVNVDLGVKKLTDKVSLLNEYNNPDFKFSDFGTRRRFSRDWQEYVVTYLKEKAPINFAGTSNVFLAMKYDITPIGTMAHEFLQACQVFAGKLRDSQTYALDAWLKEYRGKLSIALSDVVGIDAFLKDFDYMYAKIYDGVRHDSGCPYEWSDKVLNHYKYLGINAKEKVLVYSDGLNFGKAFDLYEKYKNEAKLFFGIGTNLTNDMGVPALNIVMKITECNGSPVAKISDTKGKTMSDNDIYIQYLKNVFDIKE